MIGNSSYHPIATANRRDEQEGEDLSASAEIYEASSQVTCLVSSREALVTPGNIPHPRYGC
jgi:hypothetical protein